MAPFLCSKRNSKISYSLSDIRTSPSALEAVNELKCTERAPMVIVPTFTDAPDVEIRLKMAFTLAINSLRLKGFVR